MTETRFDELFNQLVPDYGKCETLAGEIIRAANRIMRRYYNDGDIIGKGYGRETCSAAARFLERKAPKPIKEAMKELRKMAKWQYTKGYVEALKELEDIVAKTIDASPALVAQTNEYDMWDF